MPAWKRGVICAFIIFNILAIAFGSTAPAGQRNAIEGFFTPYLWWTRLLQNWRLFTPSPRKFLMNYRAEMAFEDGTKQVWQRPYPPNWDFFPRHLSYHFQKWDLASNYLEQPVLSKLLLTDLAHYLEKNFSNSAHPLKEIVFIRSRADVPPPNESGYVQPDMSHLLWHDQVVGIYHAHEGRLE